MFSIEILFNEESQSKLLDKFRDYIFLHPVNIYDGSSLILLFDKFNFLKFGRLENKLALTFYWFNINRLEILLLEMFNTYNVHGN